MSHVARKNVSALTTIEKENLKEYESVVARGMNTFLEVGKALTEIRDRQLYRETHDRFGDYLMERFNLADRHARRLMAAAETWKNIIPDVSITGPVGPVMDTATPIIPIRESQLRPLAGLAPSDQREAWSAAVESENGAQPTAQHVNKIVNTFVNKNELANTQREPGDDTEAEEAASSLPDVLDAEGTVVPNVALVAFERAKEIVAVCREIDGIIARVEELSKGEGGRLIRLGSFRQQMKDAKGNLWANRPTHVCPYCHGTKATCECCNGEGWTAKHVWSHAPGRNGK